MPKIFTHLKKLQTARVGRPAQRKGLFMNVNSNSGDKTKTVQGSFVNEAGSTLSGKKA